MAVLKRQNSTITGINKRKMGRLGVKTDKAFIEDNRRKGFSMNL